MSDLKRFGDNPRFSSVVINDNTAYLAGQVSQLSDADITAQSEDVFQKVDQLLAEIGSNPQQIISVQIWLANMDDYDAFNAVWDAYFKGQNAPIRVCVEARMAKPFYKVEILVIAKL